MEDQVGLPDPEKLEELERLGAYDPDAPDARDHLDLIRHAMARGATVEEVAAAANLGELPLDLQLRPRGKLTLRQIAAESGFEWTVVQKLVAAIGLPSDPDLFMTDAEAETVVLLATVSRDFLGESATTQLARVTGNAMARIAEWSTDEERSAVTLLRTVGFVDLVGYTERTAGLSVRELTELLMEFNQQAAELVESGNGQIVKTIGDEVMFVTEAASDACEIALDLIDASMAQSAPVRVGLATGEMISVLGDLYGSNVNLAARLVAAADPASAVVSDEVQHAASGYRFDPLPPLSLKGFSDPIVAYRVRR